MITNGEGPPKVAHHYQRHSSKQLGDDKKSRGSSGDHATKKSRGSSGEFATKKSRGSGIDAGDRKSKDSNADGGAERKSRGSSQRSSLSISAGMRTYREQAGSKMAAIAVVAREKMAGHQNELAELFRYLAFLILFVLVVFLRAPQDLPAFWNQALRARFTPAASTLDDVRISHVNFANVTSKAAFWLYMFNVLAPALETDSPPNTFMRSSLLGSIQLRQVRSEPRDCSYSVLVSDPSVSCFDTSSWTVSKSRYGGPKGDMFTWTPQPQYDVNRFLLAPDANYGTGGFIAYLSTTPDITQSTLQNLFSNGYVDDHSRAVFVDFTLQNPTESWFCMVRLLFDMSPYGGVRSSNYFRVTDVQLYDTASDQIITCIEALFVILFLKIGLVTWKEMRKGFLEFFSTLWGLIDFLNVLTFGLIIIMSVVFRICIWILYSKLQSDFYIDWQSAAYTNNQIYNLSAFNAVLSWIRVLKYLRLSRRLSMLERVFTNVRFELLAWTLLFIIIFTGFSQGFFLAFRDAISKYESVFIAMTTLFQGVYGDIDLQNLQMESALLGPLLFVIYIFVICFLMMSMFLAILQGAWMKTEEDAMGDGQDDLAAALQFAISNAKDNAKRQGFKLRNLMARQSKPPKSPRRNPKPLHSPQKASHQRSASRSLWGTLKRGQSAPRSNQFLAPDRLHSPRSPKRFTEASGSPPFAGSEPPAFSPRISSPAALQVPLNSSPRRIADVALSSPARSLLDASLGQSATPKQPLVPHNIAQAYILTRTGSVSNEQGPPSRSRRPSRRSLLLTPRQVQILSQALQSIQVATSDVESSDEQTLPSR